MSPSRNSACPCGSGKKYKRCCLASGKYEDVGGSPVVEDARQKITLAKTALDLGDVERARRALESLLVKTKPPVEALVLASSIAMREKDYEKACQYMAEAAQQKPSEPNIWYNLGTALSISGRKTEAVQAFQKALKLKPDMLIVYPNLGHTLRDMGRSVEAIACYSKVFAMPGVDTTTMSQILLSMHLFSQTDHDQLYGMHRQLASLIARENPMFAQRRSQARRDGKLRIGYISPRFSREIVGYFFKPLFDNHDRERFEIVLYNITPRTDELTAYFEERADSWVEVGSMSDREVCERILADEIDILVDLAGHAPENRIGILARKPAPIQVSMLDYFDTTGLDSMDYYVTDHFSSPADSKQRFTEELLFLDQPRLVYEAPEYAPQPAFNTHSDQPLVFGSFNRHHKLVPHVIETWSRLLQGVPGSRLVLKGTAFGEVDSQEVFLKRFAEQGIDAARIEFRGASPHAQMFAEYGDIDIALDTFPYNGGLTTCEALWMGTPVLTLLGERVISRQTAGMLEAVGLEGFTAQTEEEFVALGQHWADHRDELLELRAGLRQAMAQSPLTDAESYTRNFEARLQEIVAERL